MNAQGLFICFQTIKIETGLSGLHRERGGGREKKSPWCRHSWCKTNQLGVPRKTAHGGRSVLTLELRQMSAQTSNTLLLLQRHAASKPVWRYRCQMWAILAQFVGFCSIVCFHVFVYAFVYGETNVTKGGLTRTTWHFLRELWNTFLPATTITLKSVLM